MLNPLPILQRRRERHQREANSARHNLTRAGLGAGLTLSLAFGLMLLALGLGYANITANLPSVEGLPAIINSLRQPTRLVDRSGVHLLTVLAAQDAPRNQLPLAQLPPAVAQITLALADPTFYSHPGFSLRGLTDPQQHPTLAQRLAADLLVWDEPPSLRRALRERLLAAQITSRYGRDAVLAWYLNTANYGHQTSGVDDAARLYFGKPASQLTLAESALLAVVSQNPALNPLDTPELARQRAREILAALPAAIASPQQITSAQAEQFQFQPMPTPNGTAPAFTALALTELSRDQSRARIERGGMIITTSLDFDLYQHTVCSTQTQLTRLRGQPAPVNCAVLASLPALPPAAPLENVNASAIIFDPQTGQVLALMGEMDASGDSTRLMEHRPGSSLLPFLYLTGFSRGLSPASLVWDIPPASSSTPPLADVYTGPLRARLAMVNDVLPPAARLLDEISLPAFEQTLQTLGIQLADTATFHALLDGKNYLSPLTLARAYGALAANGVMVSPQTVLQIQTTDGVTIQKLVAPQPSAVISPQLAYLVNHVLADDSARWLSLGNPNPFELPFPSAAKLGATLDGQDIWAIAYTPLRVAVVWMGASSPTQRAAAGLSAALLTTASQSLPPEDWVVPPTIVTRTVCDPSGMLPTPACPAQAEEVFLSGYEPVQADTLYQTVAIDRETGMLATIFTAPELVEERIFMVVPPEAQNWAQSTGIEAIPSVYDTIQVPPQRPGLAISAPLMLAGVSGKISVRGAASGAGFASYRLQAGQGLNPSSWILVAEATQPVEAGVLAEWDTSGLSGLYTLQLVILHTDGKIETTAVAVTIKE